jgi:hypothetical protein
VVLHVEVWVAFSSTVGTARVGWIVGADVGYEVSGTHAEPVLVCAMVKPAQHDDVSPLPTTCTRPPEPIITVPSDSTVTVPTVSAVSATVTGASTETREHGSGQWELLHCAHVPHVWSAPPFQVMSNGWSVAAEAAATAENARVAFILISAVEFTV